MSSNGKGSGGMLYPLIRMSTVHIRESINRGINFTEKNVIGTPRSRTLKKDER